MKRMMFFIGWVLLFIAFSKEGYSQYTAGKASAAISEQLAIRLPEAQPLISRYVLDYSALDFGAEESANRYFSAISNNLLDFELIAGTSKVALRIHPEYLKESWTAKEWNAYLAEQREHFLELYTDMTK